MLDVYRITMFDHSQRIFAMAILAQNVRAVIVLATECTAVPELPEIPP
jgi:hypothetical protein